MDLDCKDIVLVSDDSAELIRYSRTTMNKEEVEFNNRVLEFYRKVFDKNAKELNLLMFDYNFLGAGYDSEKGYYIVFNGLYRYYEVVLYGDNAEAAFLCVVDNIIERKSQKNLFDNKKSILAQYHRRFAGTGITNVLPIYHIEYVLDKFDKYYDGNIPKDIVDKYLNGIRFDGMVVAEYDEQNKKILLVEKEEDKRRQRLK